MASYWVFRALGITLYINYFLKSMPPLCPVAGCSGLSVLFCMYTCNYFLKSRHPLLICSVMVSVPASNVVDCGFKPQSGQTKDNKIGICCFSANYAALKRKSKDGSARNQANRVG